MFENLQGIFITLANDGIDAARRITQRECYKVVFEINSVKDEYKLSGVQEKLESAGISYVLDNAAIKKTQKFDTSKILIEGETSFRGVAPISEKSQVAMSIPDTIYIKRIYASAEDRQKIIREGILSS